MPKTVKRSVRAKKGKGKAFPARFRARVNEASKNYAAGIVAADRTRDEQRELRKQIKAEKTTQKLIRTLRRATFRTDEQLAEIGATLLSRATRLSKPTIPGMTRAARARAANAREALEISMPKNVTHDRASGPAD